MGKGLKFMKKFLSILMLACLLCGMVLPVAAEETCKRTDGCTLADGHEGLCNALCTKTEGCTQYGGHDGECTLHCAITKNCTKANGHEGLCDAMCDKTVGCLMKGGHTGECVTELALGSDADVNAVLKSKDALVSYLQTTYPDYRYEGGDITLRLPAKDLGSITCNVQLPGTLTLKGASGKKVESLTIEADNVCVDGVTFSGAPGITLKNVTECTVTNCSFSRLPFQLQTDEGGRAPRLTVSGNIYTDTEFAAVYDAKGSEVGKWLAAPKAKPETVVLDLGVKVNQYIADSTLQALDFYVDDSVNSLLDNKWSLNFLVPCTFSSAYTACNGVKGTGVKATTYAGYYKVGVFDAGQYAVISGAYPKIVNGNVEVRAVDAEYLRTITVDTTLSGATVTYKSKQVPASINSKKLTFFLNGAGTYKVSSATTKTTTTKTTSRSYNYKYQDYYLITPQRVTDCMRYAKDNLVTIECKETGRRSISLPVASMAAAAEKGYSILLKNEKIADITIDAAALKSMAQQAKGTTVLLHYRSLNHKTLTTVGQASVQSHLDQFPNDNADLAFLLTATSDSETIEDLQLGTITLKIPFIVLPGTEDMENVVYALQAETSAAPRETTVADGHLTTRLTDLTEHMVFQVGEPVETTEETTEPTVETTVETTQPETEPETVPETTLAPEPEKDEGGFPVWIPIVVVLLLAGGGAAAWFLYFRKRLKR